MQVSVRTPKAPPMMGPISNSDFDFPCTGTVVTPGVERDVVLDKKDFSIDDDGDDVKLDDREDCSVV